MAASVNGPSQPQVPLTQVSSEPRSQASRTSGLGSRTSRISDSNIPNTILDKVKSMAIKLDEPKEAYKTLTKSQKAILTESVKEHQRSVVGQHAIVTFEAERFSYTSDHYTKKNVKLSGEIDALQKSIDENTAAKNEKLQAYVAEMSKRNLTIVGKQISKITKKYLIWESSNLAEKIEAAKAKKEIKLGKVSRNLGKIEKAHSELTQNIANLQTDIMKAKQTIESQTKLLLKQRGIVKHLDANIETHDRCKSSYILDDKEKGNLKESLQKIKETRTNLKNLNKQIGAGEIDGIKLSENHEKFNAIINEKLGELEKQASNEWSIIDKLYVNKETKKPFNISLGFGSIKFGSYPAMPKLGKQEDMAEAPKDRQPPLSVKPEKSEAGKASEIQSEATPSKESSEFWTKVEKGESLGKKDMQIMKTEMTKILDQAQADKMGKIGENGMKNLKLALKNESFTKLLRSDRDLNGRILERFNIYQQQLENHLTILKGGQVRSELTPLPMPVNIREYKDHMKTLALLIGTSELAKQRMSDPIKLMAKVLDQSYDNAMEELTGKFIPRVFELTEKTIKGIDLDSREVLEKEKIFKINLEGLKQFLTQRKELMEKKEFKDLKDFLEVATELSSLSEQVSKEYGKVLENGAKEEDFAAFMTSSLWKNYAKKMSDCVAVQSKASMAFVKLSGGGKIPVKNKKAMETKKLLATSLEALLPSFPQELNSIANQDFGAMLITPVQRMPRWKLALETIRNGYDAKKTETEYTKAAALSGTLVNEKTALFGD